MIFFEVSDDIVPMNDFQCIILYALLEEWRHLHLVPKDTMLQQTCSSCHWMLLCNLSQRLERSEGCYAYLFENDFIVCNHHDRMDTRELISFISETINF